MKRKKHWKFLRLRSAAYEITETRKIRSALAAARRRLQLSSAQPKV